MSRIPFPPLLLREAMEMLEHKVGSFLAMCYLALSSDLVQGLERSSGPLSM